MKDLLLNFWDIFMNSNAKLGCTSETKHKIILAENVHPLWYFSSSTSRDKNKN